MGTRPTNDIEDMIDAITDIWLEHASPEPVLNSADVLFEPLKSVSLVEAMQV